MRKRAEPIPDTDKLTRIWEPETGDVHLVAARELVDVRGKPLAVTVTLCGRQFRDTAIRRGTTRTSCDACIDAYTEPTVLIVRGFTQA
jgi:hypothetical protein